MKILITGGAGYIGSLAVKKALLDGHEVVIVDDLSTGCLSAVEGLKYKFYNVDIRNKEELKKVFDEENVDLVMDFAAKLIVEESVQNPELYYDVNVLGLKNVLDCMVLSNVKKIIFSSTAAVYGLLDPGTRLITEEDITIPSNPYGNSKLIGEFMVKDYATRYGLEYIIFRYFNVVGNVKYGSKLSDITTVVPVIIDSINKGTQMTVNGDDYNTPDGTCIRDFIHVEDLVNAHIVAMNGLNLKNSGIYNLSVGKGTSLLELIELTQKEVGKAINYRVGPRRIGDPVISAATNKKFTSQFNWDIKYTSVGSMINETYNAWADYMKEEKND